MGNKKVKFSIVAPQNTKEVRLCGAFTNWEQGAIVMKKGRSGEWAAQVNLEPGEYEYKFKVDSFWYNDPTADKLTGNVWGTENSIRVVR
ncbi:MAG: isoamylase early set domain-containing protein [Candidatus Margulisiibacteriota bacterium]